MEDDLNFLLQWKTTTIVYFNRRGPQFFTSMQDDLIQALKSIDPSLDSSAPALLSEAEEPEEDQDEDAENSQIPSDET